MENLKITDTEISWEETRVKFNTKFKYTTTILSHGDYFSVYKLMSVGGDIKTHNLVHVPFELIDEIKKLKDERAD